MRIVHMAKLSTAHLPGAERNRIDALIAAAQFRDGRVLVDQPGLAIEPIAYGFLVYTGEAACPDMPVLEALLRTIVRRTGAPWAMFDRDEPPSSSFPVHP